MFNKELLKSKLSQDLCWNYASFALLAISGVVINLIIAFFYGAASLGRFNLIYTIYILLSQFSVGGIHYSVLVHLARPGLNIEGIQKIFGSALLPAIMLSLFFSLLLYLLSDVLAAKIGGDAIAIGLRIVSPALLFFSINKILLAAFNGLQYMKIYAIGQGLRYILMLIFISFISIKGFDETYLLFNFLFAEVSVFLFLVIYAFIILNKKIIVTKEWLLKHIEFGFKGFLVGIFSEINTRVDILILGHFVSNKSLGIYSFAAMLAEGISQILIVLRTNLNPFLVKKLAENSLNNLCLLISNTRKIIYPALGIIAICALLIYPILIETLLPHKGFLEGWFILAILLVGIVSAAGFVPFDTILANAGYPEQQTLQTGFVVMTNIIMNFLLVPLFGTIGSAIATMIASYLLSIVYLNYLTKRNLMFNIITLKLINRSAQINSKSDTDIVKSFGNITR